MLKKALILTAVITSFGMSGCSQSLLDTSDARCPFTERGGCQSMETVNRMVTEKRYTPDGQYVQQAPLRTKVLRAHQIYK